MADVAFAAPILPGKLEAWRAAMGRCQPGNPDYVASRERLGINREAAWLQRSPAGDFAVVYVDADDLAAVFQGFASSLDPFDAWFRDAVRQVHGIDLSVPVPPAEQLVDYRG
jgi:hypothetical protein